MDIATHFLECVHFILTAIESHYLDNFAIQLTLFQLRIAYGAKIEHLPMALVSEQVIYFM